MARSKNIELENAIAVESDVEDEASPTDRLLIYLAKTDTPHTTNQIALELSIDEHQLQLLLDQLESLGYLQMSIVAPKINMVMPKKRLIRLNVKERAILKQKLHIMRA